MEWISEILERVSSERMSREEETDMMGGVDNSRQLCEWRKSVSIREGWRTMAMGDAEDEE